jgi:maltose O-acetyltransferase
MTIPRRRAVITSFANLPVFTASQRARILGRAGVHAAPGAAIESGFKISGDKDFWLGASYLNNNVYIDCVAEVRFGDKGGMAAGSMILTSHHDLLGPEAESIAAPTVPKAVTVGNRVWIGAGAIILPGVTIAERCVIGAGSILLSSTKPNGLYFGAPAKRIRDI